MPLTKSNGPAKRKALQCDISNEETQFQKEISKILNEIPYFPVVTMSVNPRSWDEMRKKYSEYRSI